MLKVAPGQSNHWIKPWLQFVRSCLQISSRVPELHLAMGWCHYGGSPNSQTCFMLWLVTILRQTPSLHWLVIVHWCVATKLSGQSFVDWAHCRCCMLDSSFSSSPPVRGCPTLEILDISRNLISTPLEVPPHHGSTSFSAASALCYVLLPTGFIGCRWRSSNLCPVSRSSAYRTSGYQGGFLTAISCSDRKSRQKQLKDRITPHVKSSNK